MTQQRMCVWERVCVRVCVYIYIYARVCTCMRVVRCGVVRCCTALYACVRVFLQVCQSWQWSFLNFAQETWISETSSLQRASHRFVTKAHDVQDMFARRVGAVILLDRLRRAQTHPASHAIPRHIGIHIISMFLVLFLRRCSVAWRTTSRPICNWNLLELNVDTLHKHGFLPKLFSQHPSAYTQGCQVPGLDPSSTYFFFSEDLHTCSSSSYVDRAY